jgi:hypothetical protein
VYRCSSDRLFQNIDPTEIKSYHQPHTHTPKYRAVSDNRTSEENIEMSRGCIRFPDCIPCAPQNTTQVFEKAEVEKVAVALYSEGRISETEMTEVVAGDRKYRREADLPSAPINK